MNLIKFKTGYGPNDVIYINLDKIISIERDYMNKDRTILIVENSKAIHVGQSIEAIVERFK